MNTGKLGISLSQIEYSLTLYREYLKDRELTSADVASLRDRVPALLEEARYLQKNLTIMDYDYFKYQNRDIRTDFSDVVMAVLDPKIFNGLQVMEGVCRRCNGKRYLSGIDKLCEWCAGNNFNCTKCHGILYTPCSRCKGIGHI
jgi:hypothetical protein